MEVLPEARKIMLETGNAKQWNEGYPSREMIFSDIKSGCGFLCLKSSEVVGYFCFMQGKSPDSNYRFIENGTWLNDLPYGVIHRLASNRSAKGIAKLAFDFAFSKTGNIRVDTHKNNIPMKRFLQKSGFTYCGIIYVANGTPREAFQKTKPPNS